VTRVITSHDPKAALLESDLVLGLRDGATEFLADPKQLPAGRLEALYG
jgi:hypothetical protein